MENLKIGKGKGGKWKSERDTIEKGQVTNTKLKITNVNGKGQQWKWKM